MVVEVELNW